MTCTRSSKWVNMITLRFVYANSVNVRSGGLWYLQERLNVSSVRDVVALKGRQEYEMQFYLLRE